MIRRFKPKGKGEIVEVSEPMSIASWRNECEYYEVDVNGNKLPKLDELIDFWNMHAEKAKFKKVKE